MKNIHKIGKELFITSDEEIKDGYAFHLKTQEVLKVKGVGEKSKEIFHSKGFSYQNDCKKIILTTDQDLIKDGVQAIDDEFLEWFVKNPSFEEVLVETVKFCLEKASISLYQIITPKQIGFKVENGKRTETFYREPKQETLEEVAEIYAEENAIDANISYHNLYAPLEYAFKNGAKWQQEQFGKSEFLQKLRGTLSDAEARRLIFEQFKNK